MKTQTTRIAITTLGLSLFLILLSGNAAAQWCQLGSDIAGDGHGGHAVSLAADGSHVAIGEPIADSNGTDSGQVRIFRWIGAGWAQKGVAVHGDASFDYSKKYRGH